MNMRKISDNEFWIASASKEGVGYTVNQNTGAFTCNCPAFQYRNKGMGCKHIEAVKREIIDNELNTTPNPKELSRGNVLWVTEFPDKVLAPLIPLGWEWTDDYVYFMIADLVDLKYSKKQILDFFGPSFSGMIEGTSLVEITRYVKALGEKRRSQINIELEKKQIKQDFSGVNLEG